MLNLNHDAPASHRRSSYSKTRNFTNVSRSSTSSTSGGSASTKSLSAVCPHRCSYRTIFATPHISNITSRRQRQRWRPHGASCAMLENASRLVNRVYDVSFSSPQHLQYSSRTHHLHLTFTLGCLTSAGLRFSSRSTGFLAVRGPLSSTFPSPPAFFYFLSTLRLSLRTKAPIVEQVTLLLDIHHARPSRRPYKMSFMRVLNGTWPRLQKLRKIMSS